MSSKCLRFHKFTRKILNFPMFSHNFKRKLTKQELLPKNPVQPTTNLESKEISKKLITEEFNKRNRSSTMTLVSSKISMKTTKAISKSSQINTKEPSKKKC